ncbi:MAG: molybdenum cofactor biosynthesis protein MoaE [Deltaproteobacteria bacterium]|nr:molybdenum cofactor biosynthesis protein MoaE [Deltaproteobacteria bacterium]
MELLKSIEKIRNHPESHRIGMIASHLGIVRGNSRNGREVTGVEVDYDMDVLNDIIEKVKSMEGIIEVVVEVNRGLLKVGDEIMFVAVGGDIRENVFPALIKAVDFIKKDCSRKNEIFKD